MDEGIDLNRVPLSRLSDESKSLISSLLNTRKILKNVCSDHIERYRDWRGLASLVNISSQIEVSINNYPDKFGKLLEIWLSNDNNATIGQLLSHLQELDRYDVHDDLIDLNRENKLIAPPPVTARVSSPEDDLITFQDVENNSPQRYHAYVLFAQQDRDFVDNMLRYLRHRGLQVCTEDDLLPGFATRFEPVARLISQRCLRIILVYSPDFFASNAVKFITHFAQAHGVESNIQNLLPIMYRYCTLPPLLAHYHNLVFPQNSLKAITDGKDDNPYRDTSFWWKLEKSLSHGEVPRLRNGTSLSSVVSGPRIQLVPSTENSKASSLIRKPETSTPKEVSRTEDATHSQFTPQKEPLLALPDVPISNSTPDISLPDSQSESSNDAREPKSMNDVRREKKSKKNTVERFFSQVLSIGSKIGKKKKVIMVEN